MVVGAGTESSRKVLVGKGGVSSSTSSILRRGRCESSRRRRCWRRGGREVKRADLLNEREERLMLEEKRRKEGKSELELRSLRPVSATSSASDLFLSRLSPFQLFSSHETISLLPALTFTRSLSRQPNLLSLLFPLSALRLSVSRVLVSTSCNRIPRKNL